MVLLYRVYKRYLHWWIDLLVDHQQFAVVVELSFAIINQLCDVFDLGQTVRHVHEVGMTCRSVLNQVL